MSTPMRDRSMRERAQQVGANVSTAGLVNIANALTMMRLALVPVFVVVLFVDGGHDTAWRWAAFAVFTFASLTDKADGYVARSRGIVTNFGKMADSIADKALVGAALIGLSLLHDLSWWATGIIIFREVFVTGLRFWIIRIGVMAANKGGKIKMVIQTVAIMLYLVPIGGLLGPIRYWVMFAAVAFTIGTGLDYLIRVLRIRRGDQRERAQSLS